MPYWVRPIIHLAQYRVSDSGTPTSRDFTTVHATPPQQARGDPTGLLPCSQLNVFLLHTIYHLALASHLPPSGGTASQEPPAEQPVIQPNPMSHLNQSFLHRAVCRVHICCNSPIPPKPAFFVVSGRFWRIATLSVPGCSPSTTSSGPSSWGLHALLPAPFP